MTELTFLSSLDQLAGKTVATDHDEIAEALAMIEAIQLPYTLTAKEADQLRQASHTPSASVSQARILPVVIPFGALPNR